MKPLRSILLLPLAGLLAGCYPLHTMVGHLDLMARREPLDDVVAAPDTPETLKSRLQLAAEMRAFASRELALPDNGSYRRYASLDGDYPVWSVWITPEFDLAPRQSCFPVVGCVPYRGYYSQASAERYAAGFRTAGDDVMVGGVTAYSTLGFFDDPLTPAMLRLPAPRLAGLIFHELAHQVIYVKDDATFNESFARAVEIEGTLRWLAQRGDAEALARYQATLARADVFFATVRAARDELAALYASGLDADAMRQGKDAVFASLREAHCERRRQDPLWAAWDPWFAGEINNAKLAAVATYYEQLEMFRDLLAQHDGHFAAFYAAVGELAAQRRRTAAAG